MAGQIQAPAPSLVNQSTVLAEKVANIAIPNTSNTIWDKLAQSNPAPVESRLSGGYSASIQTPVGTSKFQTLASKMADNSRYKLNLPNLAGKPKQGIASPSQQQVSGGKGAGANKGNTVFVDDANWPVTLREIIGSRLLTQEQLQKASIDNVKKLITVGDPHKIRNPSERSVGNSSENEEIYYMMQRMLIEGFIRGVDMTKEISKAGGYDISIKNAPLAKNPNNIGLNQGGLSGRDQIGFKASWWRNANEAEKYMLFMHEVGHGLLDRQHAGDKGDIMYSGTTNSNAKKLLSSKSAYNAMLDEHFGSATNKKVVASSRTQAGKGTDTFDPSWFPQLSGEAVKEGGSYTPGTGGGNDTPEKDYSSDFANLSSLLAQMNSQNEATRAAMEAQFAQQQQMMNQSMRLNAVNTMAGPSATVMGGVGGPQGGGVSGGTLAAGTLGMPDTQAIFAAGIADLGKTSDQDAGNILASG